MTQQHITQEVAMALVNSDAQRIVEGGPEYVTVLCNAAIQWDRDQRAKELPVLHEPDGSSTVEDGPLLHEGREIGFTTHEVDAWTRELVEAYGQQCREHALEQAALVCDDFDVCDPERIAFAIRLLIKELK